MKVNSSKRLVYVMATLVAMVIFFPFQRHAWSLYAGACAGYTVLVVGLRRIHLRSTASSSRGARLASELIRTHLTFLAIAVGWVWLCVVLKPYLPYFLTTEDTGRPYFGLAFLGILGLLCLEAVEQRWLKSLPGTDASFEGNQSSRSSTFEGQ